MEQRKIHIPSSTSELIRQCSADRRHPGLMLDKFPALDIQGNDISGQEQQKAVLEEVAQAAQDEALLNSLLRKREKWLNALQAQIIEAKSDGPFTLHLSRSTALENAGLCLHPLYGFVYLPGSGIKGLAHAYAETIWLPSQQNKNKAQTIINEIFGYVPSSAQDEEIAASSGSIIFHDAWPTQWPKLIIDIVNNHHNDYYSEKNSNPPGDWENPVPVYFLAIGPNETFSFAISKRIPTFSDDRLDWAKEWLLGGLCYLGAGAKTNAGYGSFIPTKKKAPAFTSPVRSISEHTLELVTPAFLAGAQQRKEDCELRPATLRGQLRWWWRTLHSAHVDTRTLRAMEAVIWGDTNGSGGVRIKVTGSNISVQQFNKQEISRNHRLIETRERKTTQGLYYMSYGMHERRAGKEIQRYFLPPKAKWEVELIARDVRFPIDAKPQDSIKIPSSVILDQAKAALWLLCHFGGIGAKSRKGFGSFKDIEDSNLSLDWRKERAKDLRRLCKQHVSYRTGPTESPSIDNMLEPLTVPLPWKDPWFALDQIGFSYQAFAKYYKHRAEKKALGLPRRVDGRFNPKSPVRDRHASPVLFHLAQGSADELNLMVALFPSYYLPDINTSKAILQKLSAHLRNDLAQRCKEYAGRDLRNTPNRILPIKHHHSHQQKSSASPLSKISESKISSGMLVEAQLIEQKTNKNGWKAQLIDMKVSGPIQNTADVPETCKPGDKVTLKVQSLSLDLKSKEIKQIDFRWLTPEDPVKKPNEKSLPKGPAGTSHQNSRKK